MGPWVHAQMPNRWSWRTGNYQLHHLWREGQSGRSLLLPGLAVDSLRGLCRRSCSRGRGLLGPAGSIGQGGLGGLWFRLFRDLKLRNLRSSLRKAFARRRWRGSWGLSREGKPESFILLLFGFTPPLHQGQRRAKNPLWNNEHVQDVILLSV